MTTIYFPQGELCLDTCHPNVETVSSLTVTDGVTQTPVMSKNARVKESQRQLIVEAIRAGKRSAQVARDFGLTRQRVSQIWQYETGLHSLRQAPLPPLESVNRESRRWRRFWAKVQVDPSGCWLWTGSKLPTGYGRSSHFGYAHRTSYEAVKGPISEGLQIDHICRVPACVNPDHLEAVTPKENVRRGLNGVLRPTRTHCRNGHSVADGPCRLCQRAANARSYARRKAEAAA